MTSNPTVERAKELLAECDPSDGAVSAFESYGPTIMRALIAEVERLEARVEHADDDIVWMSGADDFGPGGAGHERWTAEVHPRLMASISRRSPSTPDGGK